MQYLIGIDVGTTAVKGGLFDREGRLLRRASRDYAIYRPRPSWAEQNPDDWVSAVEDILADLVVNLDADVRLAAGICSQVNTHVFVDSTGHPLLPAIVWQDGRAAEQAARLDARVDTAQRIVWWGAPLPIDASHALSRMSWVIDNAPEIWDKTAWVMSPKDYCILRLTGRAVADPISSIGLVDVNGRYVDDLVSLVPGALDRLPPLFGPCHMVDGAKIKERTIPMAIGTMDAWANIYGSGVSRTGEGAYISGTSEIVALVSDRKVDTPGIISFPPVDGWHVHAGPTQSGGAALQWFADLTGRSIEAVLAAAGSVDRMSEGVVFLAHLEGERAPIWDPHAQGAFLGLTSGTMFADLSLGVLEGVACSVRWLFEEAEKAAGRSYATLAISGGGSRSDLWSQIRADMLGVSLTRVEVPESGVLGAAMMAGVGIGLFPSLAEAAGTMVRTEQTFTPDRRFRKRYDDLFVRYRDSYEALRSLRQTG